MIGRPLQSGFAVPPLSLEQAMISVGRSLSVLKWQMRDDHIAATAAEQCQNRDGCRVSATGRAGFGGVYKEIIIAHQFSKHISTSFKLSFKYKMYFIARQTLLAVR